MQSKYEVMPLSLKNALFLALKRSVPEERFFNNEEYFIRFLNEHYKTVFSFSDLNSLEQLIDVLQSYLRKTSRYDIKLNIHFFNKTQQATECSLESSNKEDHEQITLELNFESPILTVKFDGADTYLLPKANSSIDESGRNNSCGYLSLGITRETFLKEIQDEVKKGNRFVIEKLKALIENNLQEDPNSVNFGIHDHEIKYIVSECNRLSHTINNLQAEIKKVGVDTSRGQFYLEEANCCIDQLKRWQSQYTTLITSNEEDILNSFLEHVISNGVMHMGITRIWAIIKGYSLNLWKKNSNSEVISFNDSECYISPLESHQVIHILHSDDIHFERLEVVTDHHLGHYYHYPHTELRPLDKSFEGLKTDDVMDEVTEEIFFEMPSELTTTIPDNKKNESFLGCNAFVFKHDERFILNNTQKKENPIEVIQSLAIVLNQHQPLGDREKNALQNFVQNIQDPNFYKTQDGNFFDKLNLLFDGIRSAFKNPDTDAINKDYWYSDFFSAIQTCGPGVFQAIDILYRKMHPEKTPNGMLAEFRDTLIHEFVTRYLDQNPHNKKQSTHVYTAFKKYAYNEGWNPAGNDISLKDQFQKIIALTEQDLMQFHEWFLSAYTPPKIVEYLACSLARLLNDIKIKNNDNPEKKIKEIEVLLDWFGIRSIKSCIGLEDYEKNTVGEINQFQLKLDLLESACENKIFNTKLKDGITRIKIGKNADYYHFSAYPELSYVQVDLEKCSLCEYISHYGLDIKSNDLKIAAQNQAFPLLLMYKTTKGINSHLPNYFNKPFEWMFQDFNTFRKIYNGLSKQEIKVLYEHHFFTEERLLNIVNSWSDLGSLIEMTRSLGDDVILESFVNHCITTNLIKKLVTVPMAKNSHRDWNHIKELLSDTHNIYLNFLFKLQTEEIIKNISNYGFINFYFKGELRSALISSMQQDPSFGSRFFKDPKDIEILSEITPNINELIRCVKLACQCNLNNWTPEQVQYLWDFLKTKNSNILQQLPIELQNKIKLLEKAPVEEVQTDDAMSLAGVMPLTLGDLAIEVQQDAHQNLIERELAKITDQNAFARLLSGHSGNSWVKFNVLNRIRELKINNNHPLRFLAGVDNVTIDYTQTIKNIIRLNKQQLFDSLRDLIKIEVEFRKVSIEEYLEQFELYLPVGFSLHIYPDPPILDNDRRRIKIQAKRIKNEAECIEFMSARHGYDLEFAISHMNHSIFVPDSESKVGYDKIINFWVAHKDVKDLKAKDTFYRVLTELIIIYLDKNKKMTLEGILAKLDAELKTDLLNDIGCLHGFLTGLSARKDKSFLHQELLKDDNLKKLIANNQQKYNAAEILWRLASGHSAQDRFKFIGSCFKVLEANFKTLFPDFDSICPLFKTWDDFTNPDTPNYQRHRIELCEKIMELEIFEKQYLLENMLEFIKTHKETRKNYFQIDFIKKLETTLKDVKDKNTSVTTVSMFQKKRKNEDSGTPNKHPKKSDTHEKPESPK